MRTLNDCKHASIGLSANAVWGRIEIVRKLLTAETVTFERKLFSVNNLKQRVPPSHPVQVYSAGMGPRTVELAANH